MFDRANAIDQNFSKTIRTPMVENTDTKPAVPQLPAATLVDLFDTQLMSRHLDLYARRSKGKTFYSIGSSGHEGMAALGIASRLSDMAFLHYRDGAFLIQRLKKMPGATPLHDMALSFCASADDPISGGRHKVLGSVGANIPPQTSTIASHLPKAVGFAWSIGLARKTKCAGAQAPGDSVVLASFGDASANHSTAQGAFNSAAWAAFQGAPMPIVFICEDNDIGISVETPKGWIAATYANRPGLDYFHTDGTDICDIAHVMDAAVRHTRITRRPSFVHARTVRLMGHAGADVELAYAPLECVEAREAQDPLLKTAHQLITRQILSPDNILQRYEQMRERVARVSAHAQATPKLTSKKQVMASLVPPKVKRAPPPLKASTSTKPQPLNKQLNHGLAALMKAVPEIVLFGEDVGRKGGVYGVTSGLQERFGKARVFDTLLDEQTILGLAIGMAQNGFIPIPEIQFLAYLHNAEDQLRGEAATLSFFSNAQYTNPMVIRIAGLGYQRGIGGHFHNDNSFAVLRDIPGIIVACPSHPRDAPAMLAECVRLAREERRVVVFLEPIALYGMSDLHSEGDGLWMCAPAKQRKSVRFASIASHVEGKASTPALHILTYGNGHYLSRKAAKLLAKKNISINIIDMRWLHPLPEKQILTALKGAKRILIVDECRQTGSVSEALFTLLDEAKIKAPKARHCAQDSFIPLGPAANLVLPDVASITEAANALLKTPLSSRRSGAKK